MRELLNVGVYIGVKNLVSDLVRSQSSDNTPILGNNHTPLLSIHLTSSSMDIFSRSYRLTRIVEVHWVICVSCTSIRMEPMLLFWRLLQVRYTMVYYNYTREVVQVNPLSFALGVYLYNLSHVFAAQCWIWSLASLSPYQPNKVVVVAQSDTWSCMNFYYSPCFYLLFLDF